MRSKYPGLGGYLMIELALEARVFEALREYPQESVALQERALRLLEAITDAAGLPLPAT